MPIFALGQLCEVRPVVQCFAICVAWDRIIKHNCLVNYRRQDVFEKAIVEPFTCYADAFPKAKYYWSFEEGNFTTIGPTLTFRHGIRRYQVHYISTLCPHCVLYNCLST